MKMPRLSAWGLVLTFVIVAALAVIFVWLADPPDAAPARERAKPATASVEDSPTPPAVRDGDAADRAADSAKATSPRRLQAAPFEGIQGVVRWPLGAPGRGAEVSLYRATKDWPELGLQRAGTTVCDADGRFRFRETWAPGLYLDATEPRASQTWAGSPLVEVFEGVPQHVLTLSHGFRVSGVVQDPDGNEVRCRVILTPDSDQRRAEVDRTNASGEFEFRRAAGGVVRIEARHPYYRPVSRRITIGVPQRISLRFEEEAIALRGRVVELAGQEPISGAEVRLLPNEVDRDLYEPDTAVTDAEGRFELTGQGPGNRWIEVRHPEFSTVSRVMQVSDSTRADDLVFEMVGRARVRGRLLGAIRGGESLVIRGLGSELVRTRVSEDGSFEFAEPVSSGSVVLEIERGELAFRETRRRDLPLSLGEGGADGLELEVEPASLLVGRILGPDGKPVVGVSLSPAPPNRDAGGSILGWALERLTDLDRAVATRGQRVLAVTDDRGRFRIAGLPQGEIGLLMDGGDLARVQREVAVPPSGATLDLGEITLPQGGSISGVVNRLSGGRTIPLGGAYVFVNTAQTGLVSATTRTDGRYVLSRLAPGQYRVRARYSNFPTVRSDALVDVADGATATADLVFSAGRTVSGRVLGGDDQPVAGAVVMVSGTAGTEVRSEADGTFELEAPLSEVELWAYTEDRQVETFAILPAGRTAIDLRLPTRPAGGVVAQVSFLDSGLPATAGVLRVLRQHAQGDQVAEFIRGVSMPDGRLDIYGIPEGDVRLILHCAGAAPWVGDLSVQRGAVTELGAIRLESGSALGGLVVGPDGEPISGSTVFLGELADRAELTRIGASPSQLTGSDGQFELRGVAWCARRLVVTASGYSVAVVDVELPRDVLRTSPRVIELEVGATLDVEVVDRAGQAWERGFVRLTQDGAPLGVQPVGEGGVVTFAHVGEGDYEVAILGRSGVTQRVRVGADDQRVRLVVE